MQKTNSWGLGFGRTIIRRVAPPGAASESQYFIFLSPERVPTLAWTRVALFGKLTGRLLNPGEIKKEGLLTLPPSSSPVPKAPR